MSKPVIFRGSGTALVTPFDADGALNIEAFKRLVAYQTENQTDALVICGTTGEGSTLSDAEKQTLFTTAVRCAEKSGVPIIAGTGSNDTAHAVRLSKAAEDVGASALLIVTPYYNKTSQAGLIRHFTTIAESVHIPIIMYDVPSRTGMTIAPETALLLSAHERIAAIKAASGDISRIAQTAALCQDALSIYSGNDDQTLPILALGGVGVISVVSNILPRESHMLCDRWMRGDFDGARELQLYLLKLISALFSDVNPIPVKEALRLMGCDVGACRLPLCDMRVEAKLKLIDVLGEYGLV